MVVATPCRAVFNTNLWRWVCIIQRSLVKTTSVEVQNRLAPDPIGFDVKDNYRRLPEYQIFENRKRYTQFACQFSMFGAHLSYNMFIHFYRDHDNHIICRVLQARTGTRRNWTFSCLFHKKIIMEQTRKIATASCACLSLQHPNHMLIIITCTRFAEMSLGA